MSDAGAVTVQDAVDAYGLHAEGFPGTTRSALPAGDTISASYALALILAHRDELTAEQRAALDASLDGAEVFAAVPGSGPAGWRRAGSAAVEERYRKLLEEVHTAWIARLPNHPQHDGYELAWFDDAGESGMRTYDYGEGNDLVCRIDVHTSFRDGDPSDDKIRFFFAHELFHCMQWRWSAEDPAAGSGADPFAKFPVRNPHAWLYEGSADWAAADLYRGPGIGYNDIRPHWFNLSKTPLSGRSYDAWPLFENAARNGYDVYAKVRAMHAAPNQDVAATLQIGGLDGIVFRMQWASRTLRRDGWGADWELDWVWRGHESAPPVDNDVTVAGIGIGDYEFSGLGGFAQPPFRMPVGADVDLLTVAPSGAPLTTRTTLGTRTVGDGGIGRFCFDPAGCACPGGQTADAWPMDPGEMIVSFAASADQPTALLHATEWDPDRDCKDEPPDEASSNGDPHLVTFDGLAYDVVTLGEFVLARDAAGDFEVQTRHVPFGFGAGTTAFAVSDGVTRVTATASDFHPVDGPTVRVDGAVETRPELTAGSLRVAVATEGDFPEVTVLWPDGSRVHGRWYAGWFVTVTVPPDRAARMEGLLGAGDGDLRNDLRAPDGVSVDSSDASQYESRYALDWAVDEDASLFDYRPGESPATFRVPHPRPAPPAPDDATVERCAAALGERAAAHDVSACAYDVAASGDPGFVDAYVTVVDERASPPELAEPADVAPAMTRPSPAPLDVGAAVEARSGQPTLTVAGGTIGVIRAVAGTVLVARVPQCPPGSFADLVVISASDREDLARAPLCDAQGLAALGADADDEVVVGEAYVWIPGDGEYVVGIDGSVGEVRDLGEVEVYADPTPQLLTAADLEGGATLRVQGIADTAVLLPDPAARYDAVGLTMACAVEVYWREAFPHPDPRGFERCDHAVGYDQPPTDQIVPLVVFGRTDDAVEVRLTPSP